MRFEPFFIGTDRDDLSVLLRKILYEFNQQIRIESQDQGSRGRRYELYFGKKHFFQIDTLPGGVDKLKIEMVQTRLGQAIPDAAHAIVSGLRKAGWNEAPMFLETKDYLHLHFKTEPEKIRIRKEEVSEYPSELIEYWPERPIMSTDIRRIQRWKPEEYILEVSCPVDTFELEDQLPPLPPVEVVQSTEATYQEPTTPPVEVKIKSSQQTPQPDLNTREGVYQDWLNYRQEQKAKRARASKEDYLKKNKGITRPTLFRAIKDFEPEGGKVSKVETV